MYYLNLQKVLGRSINLIKALRARIRQTAHRLRDRPREARHGRLWTSQPRGRQGGFWRDSSAWRHCAAVAAVIAIARAGARRRGALFLVGGRFDGVEGGWLSFACLVGQVGPSTRRRGGVDSSEDRFARVVGCKDAVLSVRL